jgi:hypothetical protein
MHPLACFRVLSLTKLIVFLLLVCGMTNHLRALELNDEGRSEGDRKRELTEFLAGTKWLMYQIPGRIVEFGKEGKFNLEDWKQQGIVARWKATGPNQVTVTVTSKKFHNLTAVMNFNEERTHFTGHDLDRNRQIIESPRIDDRKDDERSR